MQWLDDQIKSKSDKLADERSKQSEEHDDESAPDFIEAYLSEMKTNSDLNGEQHIPFLRNHFMISALL